MLDRGLVDEARALWQSGRFPASCPSGGRARVFEGGGGFLFFSFLLPL